MNGLVAHHPKHLVDLFFAEGNSLLSLRQSNRHILVETRDQCEELKTQITKGGDFAALAREHSKCPSGQQGGDLGEFGPGQMVAEFDKVVFSADVGTVQGPVETQFGFHLIEVTRRS